MPSHPERTVAVEAWSQRAASQRIASQRAALLRQASEVVSHDRLTGRVLPKPVGDATRVGSELRWTLLQELGGRQPGCSSRMGRQPERHSGVCHLTWQRQPDARSLPAYNERKSVSERPRA